MICTKTSDWVIKSKSKSKKKEKKNYFVQTIKFDVKTWYLQKERNKEKVKKKLVQNSRFKFVQVFKWYSLFVNISHGKVSSRLLLTGIYASLVQGHSQGTVWLIHRYLKGFVIKKTRKSSLRLTATEYKHWWPWNSRPASGKLTAGFFRCTDFIDFCHWEKCDRTQRGQSGCRTLPHLAGLFRFWHLEKDERKHYKND